MNANPIMVRLAWHDSGTYDKEVRPAPAADGNCYLKSKLQQPRHDKLGVLGEQRSGGAAVVGPRRVR